MRPPPPAYKHCSLGSHHSPTSGMLVAGEGTSCCGKALHTQKNHGNIKKTQKLIPKSVYYLVHAAGSGARTQTCHSARQLLKILLVAVDLTSRSRQLHCKHKEEIHQLALRKIWSSPVSRGTFCHEGNGPCLDRPIW